jgi:hypothetical protein
VNIEDFWLKPSLKASPVKFHAQPLRHQTAGQGLFVAPWRYDLDRKSFFRNQAQ